MDALLEALSGGEASALVAAIERAAEVLARGDADGAQADGLARAVAAHARHTRATVRQAVALAARHLPDDAFEEVITLLLADRGQFVKSAATQSFNERSRARRVERTHDERSASMHEVRERIRRVDERALRHADRLVELALGEFVDRFHHEIVKVGTPLRVTLAAARADEAQRMLDLLLGIAATARSSTRPSAPKFRDEKVSAIVGEQIGLLRGRVGDARLARLRVEEHVDDALAFEIDRVLFAQALANLLQNAVEAYPPDGDAPIHVAVRAAGRKAGTLVAVTVEDRGRGIPQETRAHVGEPFVSTKGSGRGLGMLKVKSVIETAHGGEVEIASEVGEGTRVTLVVPRRQPG